MQLPYNMKFKRHVNIAIFGRSVLRDTLFTEFAHILENKSFNFNDYRNGNVGELFQKFVDNRALFW